MRYKLKLSRSNEILDTVEIPHDFFIKIGDVLMVAGKYHELKMIIRPAISVVDFKNNTHIPEQFEQGMAILVVGDSFPFI